MRIGAKWTRIVLLPALLAIAGGAMLLVGCGGEDLGDPTGVEAATTVDDGQVPDGAALLDQENITFIPSEITVASGEPVYLTSKDLAIHTVTINGVNVSGNMEKGDLMLWMPPGPGTYKVRCDYHPAMKSTIIVQ